MSKILIVLLLVVQADVHVEQKHGGLLVEVEGKYTDCWVEQSGERLEGVPVNPNSWFIEGVFSSGVLTLVSCSDGVCNLEDVPFEIKQPMYYVLLLALLAGFLMNFMPCVLPVIGLKLRAFAEPRKLTGYIFGVLCSFMILATLSVLLGTGLSLMGFGHYRMTLCIVCFVFAANLFGVWRVPNLGFRGNFGAFGTGILTVALGSSCAVPFLAPAIAYTATCSMIETYLIFLALGVGFVSPFILPLGGIIGKFRHYLPLFEKACAAALLLVGAWLFCTIPLELQPPALIICGSLVFILDEFSNPGGKITRKFSALVMWVACLCGFALQYHYQSNGLVEPPNKTVEIPAIDEPQVTFVTADWCLNCDAMKHTLRDSRVVQRLQELGIEPRFLDYTNRPEKITEFLVASYSRDVPTLRIVSPKGTVTVLSGLWTVSSILTALD